MTGDPERNQHDEQQPPVRDGQGSEGGAFVFISLVVPHTHRDTWTIITSDKHTACVMHSLTYNVGTNAQM